MTVSSIASLASGIQRSLNQQNNRVATAVSQLVSGNRLVKASTDVAALSTATSLQTQVSSLRTASLNISQASSLLEVADGGAQQVGQVLDRLQSLALRAQSGDLSNTERAQLDIEFQQLRSEINRVALSTNFNNKPLLDGSLTSGIDFQIDDSSAPVNLQIGGLSDANLFSSDINILTADGARAAFEQIQSAQNTVTAQRAEIGSFQQGLGFAADTLEVAIQNQEAARAELSDADFAAISTESAQAQVQQKASISLLAQTNRLSGNILTLLNE